MFGPYEPGEIDLFLFLDIVSHLITVILSVSLALFIQRSYEKKSKKRMSYFRTLLLFTVVLSLWPFVTYLSMVRGWHYKVGFFLVVFLLLVIGKWETVVALFRGKDRRRKSKLIQKS